MIDLYSVTGVRAAKYQGGARGGAGAGLLARHADDARDAEHDGVVVLLRHAVVLQQHARVRVDVGPADTRATDQTKRY